MPARAGFATGKYPHQIGFWDNADPYDGSVPFADLRIGPGVAPRASIYALRVFGCSGGTTLVPQALDWAVDPNGDGDWTDPGEQIFASVVLSLTDLSSSIWLWYRKPHKNGSNGSEGDWAIKKVIEIPAGSYPGNLVIRRPLHLAGVGRPLLTGAALSIQYAAFAVSRSTPLPYR